MAVSIWERPKAAGLPIREPSDSVLGPSLQLSWIVLVWHTTHDTLRKIRAGKYANA